jgi:hypothetical protein
MEIHRWRESGCDVKWYRILLPSSSTVKDDCAETPGFVTRRRLNTGVVANRGYLSYSVERLRTL